MLHPKADDFTLRLRTTGDDRTFAAMSLTQESGRRQLHVNNLAASLAGSTGSPVHLHMYLDGSVLEVFANETTALTARIYGIPSGPLRLKLEGAEVASLDAWQITPISKDRLTGSLCS